MKSKVWLILLAVASVLLAVAGALFQFEKMRKPKEPVKGSIEYARKFRHKKKPEPEPEPEPEPLKETDEELEKEFEELEKIEQDAKEKENSYNQ